MMIPSMAIIIIIVIRTYLEDKIQAYSIHMVIKNIGIKGSALVRAFFYPFIFYLLTIDDIIIKRKEVGR